MSKEKANEKINYQNTKQGSKKTHTAAIIITAVVVVGVLVGIIVYLLLKPEEESYNNIVTPDNVDQIIADLDDDDRVSAGSYEVVMNNDWVFDNGEAASSNAYVENSTSNTNTVYFTIALSDTNEEIYKSPYIEVGSHLTDIKLDKALDAGDYNTVVTYHLVDDDFNELSTVSMYLNMTISN